METQRGAWFVLFIQDLVGRLDYTLNIVLKFVCTSQVFQMPPETFYRVEVGTVRRQPDHPDPMFEQTKRGQGRSTLVIGSVVHHQHHPSSWVCIHQKVFEKSDEVCTVLRLGCRPTDPIRTPVVGAKNMLMLLGAFLDGRNAFLLTPFHPAGSQRRLQAQGRFVHKEELEIVSD